MAVFSEMGYGIVDSYYVEETAASNADYHEFTIGNYSSDKNFTYDIYIGWRVGADNGTDDTSKQPHIEFGAGQNFALCDFDGATRAFTGTTNNSTRIFGNGGMFLAGNTNASYILSTPATTKIRVRNTDTQGCMVTGYTIGTYDGVAPHFSRLCFHKNSQGAGEVPDKFRLRPRAKNYSGTDEVYFISLVVTIQRVFDTDLE